MSSWEEGFVFPCWIILVLSSFFSNESKDSIVQVGLSTPLPHLTPQRGWAWTVAGVNFHIHVQQIQTQVSSGIWAPQLALGLPWAAGPLTAPSRTHPFKLRWRQMLSLCLVFVQKLYKKLNLLGVKSNRNKIRSIMNYVNSSFSHITSALSLLRCFPVQSARDATNFTDVYGIKESLFKLTSPTLVILQIKKWSLWKV